MSRRTDRSPHNPISNRQKALDEQAAKLRTELTKVRTFQEKAPGMKVEAQKREQQEILSTYRRPARIEGPADHRFDLTNPKAMPKPRKLRKERSKAPWLTFVLLIAFGCVVAYAVRTLWHG
jgi:hypothetical protein